MPIRIVAANYGGPEVLETQAFDSVPLGEHDVRVAVKAAGVNPYDVKKYSGVHNADPSKLPLRLGTEASGVVTEIARDDIHGPTGPIRIGDEVIVYGGGEYATEIVAHSASILTKPTSLTFEQAGSMMTVGVTASHCLTACRVVQGDVVLIHGGAGGVGLMAVQLAVAKGATVIATASAKRHELLRDLGATPVEYGDGLLERVRSIAGSEVDAAIDLVGTEEALAVSLALAPTETTVTIANFTSALKYGITVLGGMSAAETAIRDAARTQLLELVDSGQLQVFVDRVFDFDHVADAHKAIATGHASGKIVLTPA